MSVTFPPSGARPAGLFAGRADPCRASDLATRRPAISRHTVVRRAVGWGGVRGIIGCVVERLIFAGLVIGRLVIQVVRQTLVCIVVVEVIWIVVVEVVVVIVVEVIVRGA